MQKSENREPEEVVKNEKRALLKKVLINNIKSLGIFVVLGFITIFIGGVALLFDHNLNHPLSIILLSFIQIGIFLAHFYAGKRFLFSAKNPLLDSASFTIITVITVITVIHKLTMASLGPNILLEGPAVIVVLLTRYKFQILSIIIVSFLAILMQFLGMRKGIRRKNRDSA